MQVQVLVPIALKPQPMLQSVVHGAPVFASALVQLTSLDEPPAAPVDGDPPVPDPPAPAVVVVSPPAPVVVDTALPLEPVPVVAELPPEPVADEVPVEPFTGEVPLPLSVLLEHPEGAQR